MMKDDEGREEKEREKSNVDVSDCTTVPVATSQKIVKF